MGRRRARVSLARRLALGLALLLLLPALPILAMRWIDPPTSAFIMQRHFQLWSEAAPAAVKHQWIDGDAIAVDLKLAALAAEDQRFLEHWGFDVQAITEVLQERRGKRPVRGASTISQQVAKNLFLWSGRSWIRKGLEAYFTVWIELLWPKRRILEVYLNIAQFGPNVFGAEAASREFFGVAARQLSRQQAARLVAVLPSPRRWRVDAPTPYVQGRVAWIQGQMNQLGTAYVRGL